MGAFIQQSTKRVEDLIVKYNNKYYNWKDENKTGEYTKSFDVSTANSVYISATIVGDCSYGFYDIRSQKDIKNFEYMFDANTRTNIGQYVSGNKKIYIDATGIEKLVIYTNSKNQAAFDFDIKLSDDIVLGHTNQATSEFEIFRSYPKFDLQKSKSNIVDSFGGWFVTSITADNITITNDLSNPAQTTIPINSFGHTLDQSAKIESAIFLPRGGKYFWHSPRLFVVMTNGQCFCSQPLTQAGESFKNTEFQESLFWDIKNTKQRHRTNDKQLSINNPDIYMYDPTMPESYKCTPKNVSVDNGFGWTYPGMTSAFSGINYIRYVGKPVVRCLTPIIRTKKMSCTASYINDDRAAVWVTTDGGMNWFCKYDFLRVGGDSNKNSYYNASYNGDSMSYVAGSYKLNILDTNNPSDTDKDPATNFKWSTDYTVTNIDFNNNAVIVTVAETLPSMYSCTVSFEKIGESVLNYDFINNYGKSATAQGNNLYIASKEGTNTLKLYAYTGSYDNVLRCRHVHTVSEVMDGVCISTGEEYPNGWNLLMQQKSKDKYAIINGYDDMDIVRLNSSKDSIQRACGFFIDNEVDTNVLFASDSSFLDGRMLNIEGRSIKNTRGTNGIFKGKLKDIDNWARTYECILDVPEPAIYMFKWGSTIIAGFQLNGLAVSVDNGKSFEYITDFKEMPQICGIINDRIVLTGGLIVAPK